MQSVLQERASNSVIINTAKKLLDAGKPADEVLAGLVSTQDDHIRRLERLVNQAVARYPADMLIDCLLEGRSAQPPGSRHVGEMLRVQSGLEPTP